MEAEPHVPLPDSDRDDWRDPAPFRCMHPTGLRQRPCRQILDQSKVRYVEDTGYVGVCPEHGVVEAVVPLRSE